MHGIIKKSKKNFYNNLAVKNVTEDNLFWKIIKPHFPGKFLKYAKRFLLENRRVVSGYYHAWFSFNF